MKQLSDNTSGVNYSIADPAKILAQKNAIKTIKNLPNNYKEIAESRGESSYVLDMGNHYISFVQEGLGSKNLIADEMYRLTGKCYYTQIAQDAVSAIINDLITSGATPLVLNAYWSAHNYNWFTDKKRTKHLIMGWKKACDKAGVVWGAGETQSLSAIIKTGQIELAGSAIGVITPKDRLVTSKKIRSGDSIILFASSGIHTNGLTRARKIAHNLKLGLLTLIKGKTYGEHLLKPSYMYSKLIQALFECNIDIHYMVHITGHGWRKLMRAKQDFTYRIKKIPFIPEVFAFIQKETRMTHEEMYSTFNMGAGFAIFVLEKDTEQVINISKRHLIQAYVAGTVESGKKRVIIEQKNIVFKEESLRLRV